MKTPALSPMPIPDHYFFLHQNFFWKVPQRFNVAQACCGRWAASSRTASQTAVIVEQESGRIDRYSYGALQSQANQLSNALKRLGAKRGDRVAIVMPQRFETAVAHMAITQMAAVAMPMSMLFGVEALEFRLRDSGARIVLADEHAMANVLAARALVPGVVVIGVGQAQQDGDYGVRQLLDKSSASFSPLATHADEPAFFSLYQWDDWPTKRGADSASGADWQSSGICREPELVSAECDSLLVARGLGLDRRPDGCAAAHTLFWQAHPRLYGPI